MKRFLAYFVLVFIAFVTMPALADENYRDDDENTQQFYQSLLDNSGLPGTALIVDGPGEYFNGTSGYANLQTGQLWQSDMPFFAASITKTFIAVVMLQLWQENLLDLDDPLTRWLDPSIADQLVGVDKITLRHLLNHKSGMVDASNDIPQLAEDIVANPGKVWTDEDVVPYAYGYPLFFEPGTQVRYSNTGYSLLAMVIQSVTGEHASVAVRQRILDPLDMSHTYYQVYEGDGSDLVHGYEIENGEVTDTHPWMRNIALGSSAIATTTADLARFYRAIFKDRHLLSKMARNELLKKNFTNINPIESLGLGILKTDWGNINSFWHNGGGPGLRSIVRYVPDHNLVIVGFVNFTIDSDDFVIQPSELFNHQVLSVVMARQSAQAKNKH